MKALDLVRSERTRLNDQRQTAVRAIEATANSALHTGRNLTDDEYRNVEDLRSYVERIDAQLVDLAEREAELESLAARTAEIGRRPALAVVDTEDRTDGGGRAYDRARRNIDASVRSGILPDHAAERVTGLIEHQHPTERSVAARWAATAGDPNYRGAFSKLLADPERGHLLWTAEEAAAYRAVEAVNAEMRAMSTSGSGGGYMIPLTLDPAIMLTNDGSNNPLRRLARVVQTTTNAWQGVTSAGVTSEWKAEASQAADASPTLAAPSIPVVLGDAFVPYSFEVGMDAAGFLDELTRVLLDSASQLMATAYTTGSGSGEPQGIVTGLVGGSSEINTQGSEALAATDPYDLQAALPARFSANAVWLSHIATANVYRKFETSNGAHAFPELRQTPPMLLGKPWFELSNMDSAINAAATANNYMLVYGDVAAGFVIVDRIGTTLELIPNLVGANQRPTGQRGALMWFRTGSEVVVPQALRLLDVPTTA